MIYQLHPVHGKHMAAGQAEADANEKNGWKTVTKEEFYGLAKPDDSERADLVERYVSKFGERPHHRMTNATIQSKLDE